jgi:hypothetical protein
MAPVVVLLAGTLAFLLSTPFFGRREMAFRDFIDFIVEDPHCTVSVYTEAYEIAHASDTGAVRYDACAHAKDAIGNSSVYREKVMEVSSEHLHEEHELARHASEVRVKKLREMIRDAVSDADPVVYVRFVQR